MTGPGVPYCRERPRRNFKSKMGIFLRFLPIEFSVNKTIGRLNKPILLERLQLYGFLPLMTISQVPAQGGGDWLLGDLGIPWVGLRPSVQMQISLFAAPLPSQGLSPPPRGLIVEEGNSSALCPLPCWSS